MSLKRYAILAAVSYHNNHNPNQNTTLSPQQQNTATISTSEVTTATTLTSVTGSSSSSNGGAAGGGGTVANITGNSISNYYGGGLGLFHQQNIRANSGIGLLNGNAAGNSYPNTINGNVNLLLGGAMLSLVTTILCVVCYCCHRNIKKRTEAAYRQQRQWLENDPNMEIYSVEQCYETSGLFLGESTDGLATMATLHHEPPPSYDAVVAMQEQQLLQQQQLMMQQHQLQRTSPPPGYRSSLDVNAITGATCSRGPPDGMASNDSNGNLCSSGNTCSQKQLAANGKATNAGNSLLTMKKVLNAQSCCSLQRAEVESMWNAAAAAVSARTGHGAGLTSSEVGRRHYLNHNYYRRGCPLCGKFRYNTEDTLSLSTESGLDLLAEPVPRSGNAENCVGNRLYCNEDIDNGNNCSTCNNDGAQAATIEELVEQNDGAGSVVAANEDYECSCTNESSNSIAAAMARPLDSGTSSTGGNFHAQQDYENGNGGAVQPTPQAAEITLHYVASESSFNELDSRSASDTDTDIQFATITDNNANHGMPTTPTTTTMMNRSAATETATDAAAAASSQARVVDLDTINENGIVRLDMSKIIDRTGLPNYEAALKLESSGYV